MVQFLLTCLQKYRSAEVRLKNRNRKKCLFSYVRKITLYFHFQNFARNNGVNSRIKKVLA